MGWDWTARDIWEGRSDICSYAGDVYCMPLQLHLWLPLWLSMCLPLWLLLTLVAVAVCNGG